MESSMDKDAAMDMIMSTMSLGMKKPTMFAHAFLMHFYDHADDLAD